MATIEERAEKASKILMREEHRRWYKVGYIHAITEQCKIDIEKARKWLDENARHLLSADLRQQFLKAMMEV